MAAPLSGPGVGLQLPQRLYPTTLGNAPLDSPSNEICLNAGDQLPIPAGVWYIGTGSYCVVQYLDPVNNTWRTVPGGSWDFSIAYVKSDGFNFRVANLLGCPVGGVVTAPGNGSYVQASTSIAVTGGGGSTWSPVVGGQLLNATVTSAGAGYGAPPIVMIPAPRGPTTNANGVGGIQASGYATIASGTVSGFTFVNPGAGYVGTQTITLLPNPTDPNLSTGITMATLTLQVGAAGSITGVLCTNPGNPISNPANITLTVSGAGANGTVTPIMLQTVTAVSITGGSTLTNASVSALVTSVGGQPSQGTFTNSAPYLYLAGRPRPLQASFTVGAQGTLAAGTGTIYDGGLFYAAPTPILNGTNTLLAATGTIVGSSTLALTMGSRADIVTLQPAP